jgi:hypothetical protein
MAGLFEALGRVFGLGKRGPAGGRDTAANSSVGPVSGGKGTSFHSSGMSHLPAGEAAHQYVIRRDLLRVVLRDVLSRNGIPSAWIGLQMLTAKSSGKPKGVHVRLVVQHWEPRILAYAPGLEHSFIERLMALDPLADTWMVGLSWQLALPADFVPEALPRPGSWTAATAKAARKASTGHTRPADLGGDVIAGPVQIGTAPEAHHEAKDGLERLLSMNDQDMARHTGTFDPTQPARLR